MYSRYLYDNSFGNIANDVFAITFNDFPNLYDIVLTCRNCPCIPAFTRNNVYHWHKVKHIALPMTKNTKFWWSNIKCFFTLVYHTYLELKTEILVFRNIFFDSKERGFWVNSQFVKCQTSMLCTNNRKERAMFFRRFRTMFPLSCYSKVWHVRRSGKEHFESKNVQILVMTCVSEMQFMQ